MLTHNHSFCENRRSSLPDSKWTMSSRSLFVDIEHNCRLHAKKSGVLMEKARLHEHLHELRSALGTMHNALMRVASLVDSNLATLFVQEGSGKRRIVGGSRHSSSAPVSAETKDAQQAFAAQLVACLIAAGHASAHAGFAAAHSAARGSLEHNVWLVKRTPPPRDIVGLCIDAVEVARAATSDAAIRLRLCARRATALMPPALDLSAALARLDRSSRALTDERETKTFLVAGYVEANTESSPLRPLLGSVVSNLENVQSDVINI